MPDLKSASLRLPALSPSLRAATLLGCAALVLAGCASTPQTGTSRYSRYYPASGAYRAPGPADDPWKPYIEEASNRFSVPQPWIRAVIQKESGGHEYMDGHPITSASGAMGLMQLMPQTYGDMQKRNHLGSDPYEPRNNILAGTAYIRTLYGLYGAPGFLAAYNAGIERLNDYLEDGRPLPSQTVRYLKIITPNLGNAVALSGPLAIYAGPGQPVTRTPVALGGRNQHAVLQYATLNPPAQRHGGTGHGLSRPGIDRKRAAQRHGIAEVGRDDLQVAHGLAGQRAAILQVVVQSFDPRIVRRKESRRAIQAIQRADIGRARQDVVAWLVRVRTEMVALLHVAIGLRHQLHQAHRATGGGDGMAVHVFVSARFLLDDGADPWLRHGKAVRGLLDIGFPRVIGRAGRAVGPAGGVIARVA